MLEKYKIITGKYQGVLHLILLKSKSVQIKETISDFRSYTG